VDVYRKAASAQRYYDSAQQVDSKELPKEPWVNQVFVTFDGTKDKSGERHTSMRIRLTEADVERLYHGLVQGRKGKLKELEKKVHELDAGLTALSAIVKQSLADLDTSWAMSVAGSVEESLISGLREQIRSSVEKLSKHHTLMKAIL
jgi:hypothetical protein